MGYLDEIPSDFWLRADSEITPLNVLADVEHEGKMRLERLQGMAEFLLSAKSYDADTVKGLQYIVSEAKVLSSLMSAVRRYLDESEKKAKLEPQA